MSALNFVGEEPPDPNGKLTQAEARIYELVSRYYLMQFHDDAVHREGKLTVRFGEHRFRASETAVLSPGWKALERRRRDPDAARGSQADDDSNKPPLPRLAKGDPVHCAQVDIQEKQTQPPQPFTDATLLSAMTHIARFVSDKALRQTLRDTDGLGTEATRAAIIETLFKRDYLTRESRYIRSTAKGKSLIAALPGSVTAPDRTAVWEATLERIRQGEGDPRAFLGGLQAEIRDLVQGRGGADKSGATPGNGEATDGAHPEAPPHCPKCRAVMTEREGRFGRFFACTRFPGCKGTRPIEDAAPTDGTGQKPVPCPHCFSPLVRRQGKKGWFWGCSNFPACRQTVDDINGEPAGVLRKTT